MTGKAGVSLKGSENVKNLQKTYVNIESAGRAVRIAPTESVLNVRTVGNIDQLVLSPVLFRGQWTMPVEIIVRDRDGKQRRVLKQAQPLTRQHATVLVDEKRYFVTEVTGDELASDETMVR